MRIFRKLAQMLDVNLSGLSDGDALVWDEGTEKWVPGAGGGGGAPTDADYLVGTANGSLSGEIVVGTAPGGELGGTWASPTVDTVHSGSSHATVQAAAEATAAAALSAHASDTTGIHGIADTSALLDTGDIGVTVQAHDADLDTYAGITPSANVQSVLGAADYAAIRTLLGLVIGTNVQAFDTDLSTWAGLTPSAFFQTLVDDADAATARATLGVIASLFQNGGAQEISIAGLDGTPTDLQTHLDDTSDAHDASAISIADSGANYTATDVEGVLAEIAPQLGGSFWTEIIKQADESVSSSATVQNDDELFFTAANGVTYEFEMMIIYASPAGGSTPDLKWDLGEDATATRGQYNGIVVNTADTAQVFALTTAQGTTGGAGTNTLNRCFTLRGYHAGAGGTFRFRWSQNTSNGNATIVRAGSLLRYRQLI